jgi:hypothetical protein
MTVLLTGVLALAPVCNAKAGAAYASKWTQTSTWTDTIAPALLKTTDAGMVYRELKLGFEYQVMREGDVYELYKDRGAKIPAEALQRLYTEGWISGYLYKTLTGQALVSGDMSAVFDPAFYYASNPWLQGVIDPNDREGLFQNFLAVGMQVGAVGSPDFNPACYKANYPDLAQAYGNNNANYYIHYILYGKQTGMSGDRLLKKNLK